MNLFMSLYLYKEINLKWEIACEMDCELHSSNIERVRYYKDNIYLFVKPHFGIIYRIFYDRQNNKLKMDKKFKDYDLSFENIIDFNVVDDLILFIFMGFSKNNNISMVGQIYCFAKFIQNNEL